MILSQKILDEIAKEAVVYRSNFNAYKYDSTDRCGFYNCIAGMHHPTCPNYDLWYENNSLVLKNIILNYNEALDEPEFDDEDW